MRGRRAQTARPPKIRPPPPLSLQVPIVIGKGDNIYNTAQLLPGVTGSVKLHSVGFTLNGAENAYMQPQYAGPNYSSGSTDFTATRKAKLLSKNLNNNFLMYYPPAPYMSAQETQHQTNFFYETYQAQALHYILADVKYYRLNTQVAPLLAPPPPIITEERSDSSCAEAPDVLVVHLDGAERGGDSELGP